MSFLRTLPFPLGQAMQAQRAPPSLANHSNNSDKYPLNNSLYNSLWLSRERRLNMKVAKSLCPLGYSLGNLCR